MASEAFDISFPPPSKALYHFASIFIFRLAWIRTTIFTHAELMRNCTSQLIYSPHRLKNSFSASASEAYTVTRDHYWCYKDSSLENTRVSSMYEHNWSVNQFWRSPCCFSSRSGSKQVWSIRTLICRLRLFFPRKVFAHAGQVSGDAPRTSSTEICVLSVSVSSVSICSSTSCVNGARTHSKWGRQGFQLSIGTLWNSELCTHNTAYQHYCSRQLVSDTHELEKSKNVNFT